MVDTQARDARAAQLLKTLPPNYLLYVGTYGMEDPTRAGLIFAAANEEYDQYQDAVIALLGNAVFLLNDTIAAETRPSARASLQQLIAEAVDRGIKIFC